MHGEGEVGELARRGRRLGGLGPSISLSCWPRIPASSPATPPVVSIPTTATPSASVLLLLRTLGEHPWAHPLSHLSRAQPRRRDGNEGPYTSSRQSSLVTSRSSPSSSPPTTGHRPAGYLESWTEAAALLESWTEMEKRVREDEDEVVSLTYGPPLYLINF